MWSEELQLNEQKKTGTRTQLLFTSCVVCFFWFLRLKEVLLLFKQISQSNVWDMDSAWITFIFAVLFWSKQSPQTYSQQSIVKSKFEMFSDLHWVFSLVFWWQFLTLLHDCRWCVDFVFSHFCQNFYWIDWRCFARCCDFLLITNMVFLLSLCRIVYTRIIFCMPCVCINWLFVVVLKANKPNIQLCMRPKHN